MQIFDLLFRCMRRGLRLASAGIDSPTTSTPLWPIGSAILRMCDRTSRSTLQTLQRALRNAAIDALHEQVKLIAEGHTVLIAHIVDMKGGIERLEAGQASLGLRVSVVESRVTDVEKTQKIMLAEVRSLAARK